MNSEQHVEFLRKVTGPRPNYIRFGQHAMNCLYEFDKELYQTITDYRNQNDNQSAVNIDGEIDPFYNDDNITRFFSFVALHVVN